MNITAIIITAIICITVATKTVSVNAAGVRSDGKSNGRYEEAKGIYRKDPKRYQTKTFCNKRSVKEIAKNYRGGRKT